VSFVPKPNNLGEDCGGPEHCQSSEATGHMNVSASQPSDQCDYETHSAGQSSQQSEAVDIGEADGDEQGGRMQEQMEMEDEDGLAVDLNSDEDDVEEDDDEEDDEEDDDENDDENDEDVPIPNSWNLDMSTVMTVNDGHESSWEYHMNNVEIGAQYSTKQALREAVTKWAITTQRIFQTDVSNKQYLTMTCAVEGCPARVHGHVPKYDIHWVVKCRGPHLCP